MEIDCASTRDERLLALAYGWIVEDPHAQVLVRRNAVDDVHGVMRSQRFLESSVSTMRGTQNSGMSERGGSSPPRRRQLEMRGRVAQQQHEQERADQ